MAPSSPRNRGALEPILKQNVGNMSLALLSTTSHASTQHHMDQDVEDVPITTSHASTQYHMDQDVEDVPIATTNAPEKSAKLLLPQEMFDNLSASEKKALPQLFDR
jgi:hypothetical protein